jgi:hypothetical protein
MLFLHAKLMSTSSGKNSKAASRVVVARCEPTVRSCHAAGDVRLKMWSLFDMHDGPKITLAVNQAPTQVFGSMAVT